MMEKFPESSRIYEEELAVNSLHKAYMQEKLSAALEEIEGVGTEQLELLRGMYTDLQENNRDPKTLQKKVAKLLERGDRHALLVEGEETPMILEIRKDKTIHRSLIGPVFGEVPTNIFMSFLHVWSNADSENHFKH